MIAGRGFVRGRPEPLSPAAEQTVAVVAAVAAAAVQEEARV